MAGCALLLGAALLGLALDGVRGAVAVDRLSSRVIGPPSPVSGEAALRLAHFGDRTVVAVALAAVAATGLFLYRRVPPALAVFCTGVLTQLLVLFGKREVDRTLFSLGRAYPSGHVAGATAVFVLTVLLSGRFDRPTRWLVGGCVAVVPLGAALGAIWTQSHVLTDVVGGSLVGSGAALLVWAVLGPSAGPAAGGGNRYISGSRRL